MKTDLKKIVLFTYAIFCINLLYAQNNQPSNSIEKVLSKYIPVNYVIYNYVEGKLNHDALNDYALIIKHLEYRDSIFLLVLFQKSPLIFEKSIESRDFLSEYDNNIRITSDSTLQIETVAPWNGVNTNIDEIKFINNQWFYVGHSSSAYAPEVSWTNSVNFINGEYKIRHEVTDKYNKSHLREINGLIDKKGPFPIDTDCSKYMVTKYKGKDIYIFGRADLWSYEEINEFNK